MRLPAIELSLEAWPFDGQSLNGVVLPTGPSCLVCGHEPCPCCRTNWCDMMLPQCERCNEDGCRYAGGGGVLQLWLRICDEVTRQTEAGLEGGRSCIFCRMLVEPGERGRKEHDPCWAEKSVKERWL